MNRLMHVILFTPEIDRMKRFYAGGLGLSILTDTSDWVEFDTSGATLALHAMPDLGRKGIQIRFEEPDVESRARTIESRGAQLDGGIQSFPMGKVACFWDPEGCLLSLFQPYHSHSEGSGTKLSLVIVNARDMGATRAFYRNVLGLSTTVDSPWWVEFDTGSAHLALHPRVERAGRESHHGEPITLGFSTEDLEAWADDMRFRGVNVSAPRDDGLGLRAEAVDPDGNALAFSEVAAPVTLEERLAEPFEDATAPGRMPIRKPLKKGSKAVSRMVTSLGSAGSTPAKKKAAKGRAVGSKKQVVSARGSGPTGSRVRPKRVADSRRARAKPAIGRLRKAERRTLTRKKRAVANASKSKPIKRAAARKGGR